MANQSPELKKTLTAVDRTTKSLLSAADVLNKTFADQSAQVAVLATQAANLATDIEFKTNELDTLNLTFEAQQREKSAELRLRVKEDEDAVLAELLKARGVITVTPAELTGLKAELETAKKGNDVEVQAAVKAAKAEVTQTYEIRLQQQASDHKVEIAQLNADASSDKKTIENQAIQISQLRDDLAEERKARVQTEEARSRAQGIVVNTSGK